MTIVDLLVVAAALALAACHGLQVARLVSGARVLRRQRPADRHALRRVAAGAGALPGISAIIPVDGDADAVQRLTDALFEQRYRDLEVILVLDSDTSGVFDAWAGRGALRPIDPPPRAAIPTEHVRAVFTTGERDVLLIVDKRGHDPADALNAGLNVASRPLVLSLAHGVMPGGHALIDAAIPFALDPKTTVTWAAPAAINPTAAAATSSDDLVGSLDAVRRSRRRLESLAAAPATPLTLAPFTFALFRRDVLLQLGGFEPYAANPEATVAPRLQSPHLAQIGDVVVRSSLARGWSTLARDHAIDTPLARATAIVEVGGWLLTAAGFALGAISGMTVALFASAAIGIGLAAALVALLVDAIERRPTLGVATALWCAALAALEQVGPRQLAALTRLRTWLAPPRHNATA